MKGARVSPTALKVALSLIALNQKPGWAERLPPGLVERSEKLLGGSRLSWCGPRLIAQCRRPWALRLFELADLLMPGQLEGFGHRKCFMDEQTRAAIEAGVRQVFVLGAGFDTLALRLGPQRPDVRFFEVDRPGTSAAKRRGLEAFGQAGNVTLIAADLGDTPLSKVMAQQTQWDASEPSLLIAEGVFPYLCKRDVFQLLREAAACTGPGSRVAFTHCIPEWPVSSGGRLSRLVAGLVGEPILSSVASADLPDYIDGSGWHVISDVDEDPSHGIERYAVAERLPA